MEQKERRGSAQPWEVTCRESDRWEARRTRTDGSTAVVRLFRRDCLAGMQALDAASVDVVVTSPPYNLGIRYSKYDDTIPRAEYLRWIGEWAAAVKRVLAPDGSLFLNVGGKPSDPWVPFQVAETVGRHLTLQNTIHWVKSIAIDPETMGRAGRQPEPLAVGHFKPIQSKRFLNDCHEYIFHFTHTGQVHLDRLAIGVPYQDKSNIGRWQHATADRRCRGNTWYIPYDTIQSRQKERPHPASFPVALPEWCYRLHGLAAIRACLDPFLGIGASALAAVQLGLSFVGFELDEGYFEEAIARVEACLAGQAPRKVEGPRARRDTGGAGTLPF